MPRKETVSQFAVKVTGDTRNLPIITIDHIALHFWLFKEGEAILYISTDEPVSRQTFRNTHRGHAQIVAAGLTIEKGGKTEDLAKLLIQREWATGKWKCTCKEDLEQLVEEAESE